MHVPAHVPLRHKNAALTQKKCETRDSKQVQSKRLYNLFTEECVLFWQFCVFAHPPYIHTEGTLTEQVQNFSKQSVHVELRKNVLN